MSLQSEPTMSQLRREIDRGRTGDNVESPDPVAAPPATDEEAGGAASTDAARAAVARSTGPMMLAVLALLAVALAVLGLWAIFQQA